MEPVAEGRNAVPLQPARDCRAFGLLRPGPVLGPRRDTLPEVEYLLGDCEHAIGHLTQVRFNARPELTLFTLHRAPDRDEVA